MCVQQKSQLKKSNITLTDSMASSKLFKFSTPGFEDAEDAESLVDEVMSEVMSDEDFSDSEFFDTMEHKPMTMKRMADSLIQSNLTKSIIG